MNLLGIARAINDLATRARAQAAAARRGARRHVHDHEPGTVRLDRSRCRSSTSRRPAILGVRRRSRSAPVVIDDAIAIRHMVYISMSWDHRRDRRRARLAVPRAGQAEPRDVGLRRGPRALTRRGTPGSGPPGSSTTTPRTREMHDLAERRLAGEIRGHADPARASPGLHRPAAAWQPDHLVWTEERIAAAGAELRFIDRGGSLTFHGPGQLVGYPVLDLGPRPDADAVRARARGGRDPRLAPTSASSSTAADVQTGVWSGPSKVCAIGVRLMRMRVSLHGFALNCDDRPVVVRRDRRRAGSPARA